MPAQPQFLRPTSRQYPIDAPCSEIIAALEARHFDVPGITVEFDVYGSGEQKMRLVRTVRGEDFCIRFSRQQGLLPGGRWNDTAAVASVGMPGEKIEVYADESGPTYYLYVGVDWAADCEQFFIGPGVNSKLRGEPRTYLRYSGRGARRGQRPPKLIADDDLGREYDPVDEPHEFSTAQMLSKFEGYLINTVLAQILAHPTHAQPYVFSIPELIPFPDVGPLYCHVGGSAARRIQQGQADPSALVAAQRYGVKPGLRLCSLDVKNDGTLPDNAYEGFVWCGLGTADVPERYRSFFEEHTMRVLPRWANDVYVVDHDAYEVRCAELAAAATAADRDRFTREEIDDAYCTRARTMVPITEYHGEFKQPVVLIGRELGLDEVELVEASS